MYQLTRGIAAVAALFAWAPTVAAVDTSVPLTVSDVEVEDGEIVSTGGDRPVLTIEHDQDEGEHFGIDVQNHDFSHEGGVNNDTVVQMGFGTEGNRSGAYWQFERKYNNPGQPLAYEMFIQTIGEDGSVHRPLSFYMPRAGQVEGSIGSFQVDKLVFQNWAGDEILNFNLGNGNLSIVHGASFWFSMNDKPILRQLNASGDAFLLLPFYNRRDELQTQAPIYQNTPAGINVFGVSAYDTRLMTDPQAGGYFLDLRATGGVEGDFTVSSRRVSVSGTLYDTTFNNHPTGQVIESLVSVGGDVGEMFKVGSTSWLMGQHADSGQFRIAMSDSLSQNIALSISPTTYLASFAGPVRVPTFSTGNVPSPQSVGAGSIVWLSNASGGGHLAVSNGSAWLPIAVDSSAGGASTTAASFAGAELDPAPTQPVPEAPQPTEQAANLHAVPAEAEAAAPPVAVASAEAAPRSTAMASAAGEPQPSASAAPPATHQMAHLGSAESAAAQVGPTHFVTSDSAGNMAYSSFGPADIAALTSRVGTVEGQIVGLEQDMRRANAGIAAAMAMGGTMIPPGTRVAVSFNLATFAGEEGFSASGVARITDNVWVNAGVAGSTVRGSTGGRAGITVGW